MQEKFSSLSEILSYFSNLSEKTVNILTSINNAMFTTDNSVTITLTDSKGKSFDYIIPSFNYINKKMQEIDSNVRIIKNGGVSTSTSSNTTIASEPKAVENLKLSNDFFYKENVLFENLLNPTLYTKLDISNSVSPEINQVIYKRLIIKNLDNVLFSFLDDTYLAKNDLSYDSVISTLSNKVISYLIDEKVINLPPVLLNYSGRFDLIQIYSDVIDKGLYFEVKKYKLSSLSFKNNLTGTDSSLKAGDILIANDGITSYEVISIPDYDNNIIILGLKSGIPINIGVDVLSISSGFINNRFIEIPVTYNERQFIFIKSINPSSNTSGTSFGKGIYLRSSDFKTSDADKVYGLDEFYIKKTYDFGEHFLNLETQKVKSIVNVEKPNKPILDLANFTIKPLNDHRFQNSFSENVLGILSKKEDLEGRRKLTIAEIDRLNKLSANLVKAPVSTVIDQPSEIPLPQGPYDNLLGKTWDYILYKSGLTDLTANLGIGNNQFVYHSGKFIGVLLNGKLAKLTDDPEIYSRDFTDQKYEYNVVNESKIPSETYNLVYVNHSFDNPTLVGELVADQNGTQYIRKITENRDFYTEKYLDLLLKYTFTQSEETIGLTKHTFIYYSGVLVGELLVSGYIKELTKLIGSVLPTSYTVTKEAVSDEILADIQNKTLELASINNELKTVSESILNAFNTFNEQIKEKYIISGVFAIPNPVYNEKTGNQEVIQFNIKYRYLPLSGDVVDAEKYTYLDTNGNKITVVDDKWVHIQSSSRYRQKNSNGDYVLVDFEKPCNILQIPVNSNESVEIQVQSISEVGFPEYKITSDWSDTITIKFPEEKFNTDSNKIIYKSLLEAYFKDEYFKELNDLKYSLNVITSTIASLEADVINMKTV